MVSYSTKDIKAKMFTNVKQLAIVHAVDCTAINLPLCEHKAGWFQRIPYWFWTKRVFVCEGCMQILDAKTMQPLRT